MSLSDPNVKLHITKLTENNIFECMTLIFLNAVSKQFKHNLNVHILRSIYVTCGSERENKYCSDFFLRYTKNCTYNF